MIKQLSWPHLAFKSALNYCIISYRRSWYVLGCGCSEDVRQMKHFCTVIVTTRWFCSNWHD